MKIRVQEEGGEWIARHETSPQGETKMLGRYLIRKTSLMFPVPDLLPLTTDPPMKENPYEDVELHGRCLGKKCVLTFPGSPTSSIPDTPSKV